MASLNERLSSLSQPKGSALPIKLKELPEPSVAAYLDLAPDQREEVVGPSALKPGTLTEPRDFNLMFETYTGAVSGEAIKVYLRPETAQGIFANFKNVVDTGRVKVPFGIAQVGKSFRNEINPRNFTFRSREFEQMEIEFFCRPEEAAEWYAYWRKTRFQWYVDHGLKSERLRLRDHDPKELAFYSKATADIEYEFPFGISEPGGDRSSRRLRPHAAPEVQRQGDLTYFDEEKKERYSPSRDRAFGRRRSRDPGVPLRGVSRGRGRRRDPDGPQVPPPVRKPIKAAVLSPLVKRDGMPEMAEKHLSRPQETLQCLHGREGRDRPPLPSPGRSRNSVRDHRRRPDYRRRDRHLPRPRQLPAVASPLRQRGPGPPRPPGRSGHPAGRIMLETHDGFRGSGRFVNPVGPTSVGPILHRKNRIIGPTGSRTYFS